MRIRFIFAAFFLLTGLMAAPTFAQCASCGKGMPWVVYRVAAGEIAAESLPVARKMYQKALAEGYITLWLQIEQLAADGSDSLTDQQYGRVCVAILQPLVDQQLVTHPTSGPTNSGSVCLVRASASGVTALLHDERIHQILGAN